MPLTAQRHARLSRYVNEWRQVEFVLSDGTLPTAHVLDPDVYGYEVILALQADASPEARSLCQKLYAKMGGQCEPVVVPGIREFDSVESALKKDPFLMLYKARHVATSGDGSREFFRLRRPEQADGCNLMGVLAKSGDHWSLERVTCSDMN